MKKNNFQKWMEGNFSLDEAIAKENLPQEKQKEHNDSPDYEKQERNYKIYDHFYPFLAVIFGIIMIVFFLYSLTQMPPFGSADSPANSSIVVSRYLSSGLKETGAVNIVAGVILDYRAFDTLGESHVLFTAATVVSILLLSLSGAKEKKEERKIMEDDSLLKTATLILVPFIFLFGIYVILCGHLGPGGGFSGGSIIGGGLILYSLAYGTDKLERIISFKRYKIIVLCSLCFYSLAKCYSFYCGANGLETIFTTGTPGAICSAGLILPLNIAVGIVVALTMYGFYAYFTRRHI